jgi:hypothetical protein
MIYPLNWWKFAQRFFLLLALPFELRLPRNKRKKKFLDQIFTLYPAGRILPPSSKANYFTPF